MTLDAMLILLGTQIITYLNLGISRSKVSASETWMARVPFSIYLGWITVATVANITDVLDFVKWNRFGIAPEIWMGIVLAAVLAIAMLMNFTRKDVAYALVILWALAGITVKQAGIPAVVIPTWITFGLVALTLVVAFLMPGKGIKSTRS
jgi:benzodiazapine receptor